MTTAPSAPVLRRLLWPLLAAALVTSWASGFIGIRYASDHATVFQVLFWRNLLAGALLLLPALMIGPRIGLRALLQQMGFGCAIMFLYLGGFALAIGQRVPTGLVALISDLVPLAIAVLSAPVLRQPLKGRQWLGTALGAAGVVIASAGGLRLGTAPFWAYLLTVAAMLVFAVASVLQKKIGAVHMPVHQSLAIQCLTAAGLFGICLHVSGGLAPPSDPHFWFGVGWLVLFATFFCYSTYFIALRIYPAAQVSSAIYLSPPVTMIWAWALFAEPLTLPMGLGLAVTLAGVRLSTVR
ncbi:DMT family transporter [Paragemmobacter straminiformis]|uniref:DMT family transporter n=1 Tax=Paragemmobacter straminiformis TaxID=2045119 RepID=A0A842I5Z4_9RHOB|nr:DMT family transporter [Gemmobacter straminiformis]MBC2835035.1 DMT family transporter [Gemmobacter straminiformis]